MMSGVPLICILFFTFFFTPTLKFMHSARLHSMDSLDNIVHLNDLLLSEDEWYAFIGGGKGSSVMPLQTSKSASPDLFDLQSSATTRKTPESFLGPNAALVNLDSLVTKPAQPAPVSNPFLAGGMIYICCIY